MKSVIKKTAVLLFVFLLSSSVFAATANKAHTAKKTATNHTMMKKAKNHCKYIKKCTRNKKNKNICKRVRVCDKKKK